MLGLDLSDLGDYFIGFGGIGDFYVSWVSGCGFHEFLVLGSGFLGSGWVWVGVLDGFWVVFDGGGLGCWSSSLLCFLLLLVLGLWGVAVGLWVRGGGWVCG